MTSMMHEYMVGFMFLPSSCARQLPIHAYPSTEDREQQAIYAYHSTQDRSLLFSSKSVFGISRDVSCEPS